MTPIQVLDAFDNIRRAQRAGVYAPHKPLLILLALSRLQHGSPRLVEFSTIDTTLRQLLSEFGPSSAAKSRHYPFWHLATDGNGAIWQLQGPQELLRRPAGATPTLGELRENHVEGGFPEPIQNALRDTPGLLEAVASHVLETNFPETLHADITAALGLDLSGAPGVRVAEVSSSSYPESPRRGRDPSFRERVLRAYEYRCCVCGFDLRLGLSPAGLEAAHIHWHHMGGPDIEANGLSLCSLHHKLFDLGAFTVDPAGHRVVFSQFAISGNRQPTGELQYHGRPIHPPQDGAFLPAPAFLQWNRDNVFKAPARQLEG